MRLLGASNTFINIFNLLLLELIMNFDKHYNSEKYFFGKDAPPYIKKLLTLKNSGTVLDLGCGEGPEIVFFAQNGFDVLGVDISEVGLKKAHKLAEEKGIKVKTQKSSITNFKYERDYDIILSLNTLHFLKEADAKRAIQKMKEHTKKNGINVLNVFTNVKTTQKFAYLFRQDELKELYSDWKIIRYNEGTNKLRVGGKISGALLIAINSED